MLFRLTVAYLLLEFGRPQELLPFLAPLHLPFVVTIALGLAVILARRIDLSDKETRLFLVLLALMAIQVPLAENHFRALMVLKTMFLTFLGYLGIVMSINTVSKFRTLIPLWLGVHVLLAFHGIAKRGQGIGGFIGDENDFAMTINMIVPFAFFLAQTERQRTKKLLYFGVAGLFVLANVFSFSRGGFVGLCVVGLYCWLRSPKKLRSFAVMVALGLVVSLAAREGYRERIDSIWVEGASAGTGEDRVYMWKVAWKMFLANPVIGVGQDNFPVRFEDYEAADRLYGVTRAWRAAHSLYFTLLTELGLVGAFLFLRTLYFIRKDLVAIRQSTPRLNDAPSTSFTILPYANAMEASLWGFLVSSIFISTLYYPNFWVTMGLVVALRRIVTLELPRTSAEPIASDKLGQSSAIRNRPRPLRPT